MSQNVQRKWFAFVEGEVKGPYDRNDLENRLIEWGNPLIWGRGQTEWVKPEKWLQILHQTEELIRGSHIGVAQLWKIRHGDQETKSITHAQMMNYLKGLTSLNGVQLWTEGYSEWRDIFQIHKIMDDLGVSRRVHPRVPIMGLLICEDSEPRFTARLQSISEGGLGVTDIGKVKIGTTMATQLKSPNIDRQLNVDIEVVYISNSGYAGIKFVNLSDDNRRTILAYVEKFKAPIEVKAT